MSLDNSETFKLEEYKLAGHLSPWYAIGSLLNIEDLLINPYGFSLNPIDDEETSYKIAKMTARLYCKHYSRVI